MCKRDWLNEVVQYKTACVFGHYYSTALRYCRLRTVGGQIHEQDTLHHSSILNCSIPLVFPLSNVEIHVDCMYVLPAVSFLTKQASSAFYFI